MSKRIKNIIIDSEINGTILGGEEFVNDNSDVWVEFENGDKYVATFFTYKNIQFLRNRYKETGENLGGKYFWASNFLLIDRIDRESIEKVIDELLSSEYFFDVFEKIEI